MLPTIITPADGAVQDNFGYSVSLSWDGRVAAIGGPIDSASQLYEGSARVFNWNGTSWNQTANPLLAASPHPHASLGTSVALNWSGTTALVGAPDYGFLGPGAARVFDLVGGSWLQRGGVITPIDGAVEDHFGTSVSLSADGLTAVVGAKDDDVSGRTDQGSARVFTWDGVSWNQLGGTLTPADGQANDFFGHSVAFAAAHAASANVMSVVVGGSGDNIGSNIDQGSARVFDYISGGWVQRGAAITPTGATSYDWFGYSVDISANGLTTILGGPGDSVGTTTNQGSARVFDWDGTSWQQRGGELTLAGGLCSHIGSSVALTANGMTAIVGAPFLNPGSISNSGGALVYDWNGSAWVQRGAVLTPPDRAVNDAFGVSVDITDDGMIAIIGGKSDDVGSNTDQGSGRIFIWDGTAWVYGTDVPELSLSGTTVSQTEGTGGTTNFSFTALRSGSTLGTSTATWTITPGNTPGTTAADFAQLSGVVTFPSGSTTPQTILVPVVADALQELDENFVITLSNVTGGMLGTTISAQGIIIDDEARLSITADQVTRAEGSGGGTTAFSFTVTRTGSTGGTAIANWAVSGSGSNPANGADFGIPTSGNVIFGPGVTTPQQITVNVNADTAVELDEDFIVTLSNPTNAVIGTAIAGSTIINDDAAQLSIAGDQLWMYEGTGGGATVFGFTVTRSGANLAPASASWAVTGSGTNPANAADFLGGVLPSGTVTFGGGNITADIDINVNPDAVQELVEGFTVTLTNPAGATLGNASSMNLIIDDDPATDKRGTINILPLDANKFEGNAGATIFPFQILVVDSTSPIPISFTTSVTGNGSSPANGLDFTGGAFPAALLSSLTTTGLPMGPIPYNVSVNGDLTLEADEGFRATLSAANGIIIGNGTATATIRNDDSFLNLQNALLIFGQPEGQSGPTNFNFTVLRSGSLNDFATVNWAASVAGVGSNPANAADFANAALPSGQVHFNPGESAKSFTVQIAGDGMVELDERFRVTLSAPTGAQLGPFSTAQRVIENDDTTLGIVAAQQSKLEGTTSFGLATNFSFAVYRNGNTDSTSTVDWSVIGAGTAPANAGDFIGGALPSGSLTFNAAETVKTINVKVRRDSSIEPNELFQVVLSNAVGATLFNIPAGSVIRNDDGPRSMLLGDAMPGDGYGSAVALSGNGGVALLGAPGVDRGLDADTGSASLLGWGGFAWSERGPALRLSDNDSPMPQDRFGAAVALSADGTVAMLGAPGRGAGQGAAAVFVLQEVPVPEQLDGTPFGLVWSQRGGLLTAPNGQPGDGFGGAVALAAEGSTGIIIGVVAAAAFHNVGGNDDQGAAWVFNLGAAGWTASPLALTPSDGAAGDMFGQSIDISANGQVVILGGPGDDVAGMTDQGSARIFTASAMGWNMFPLALTGIDGAAGDMFGSSVSLTPDGMTAIIGGPGDDVGGRANQGSALVFTASAMGWSARGGAITPMDGQAGDGFGTAVAVSDNGLIAILGAPGADVDGKADQGGARVFAWDGSGWNQRGGLMTPEDGMAGDMFGSAVALSADGLTALVGGGAADGGKGAARSFAWTGTMWVEGLPASAVRGPSAMSPEILGTDMIDILTGTDDADTFDGLGGLDTMIGQAGDDQYRVRDAGVRIIEDAMAPGGDTAWAMVAGWTMNQGLEFGRLFGDADGLFGSDGGETLVANQARASSIDGGAGDDMIWGGPLADLLIGDTGDDTIRSGAVGDVLVASSGNLLFDLLVGGPGDDQFVIENGGVVVATGDVDGDGYDTAWVQVDGWTLSLDIELARLITDNARLIGNAQNNVMSTEGYNTSLDGAGGNDELWGSAGPDMLIGGGDADTLLGGEDVDTAWFSGNQAESRIGMRDGVVIVSGPDGEDRLDGVELVQFGTSAPVAIAFLQGRGGTEELALIYTAGTANYVLPTIYSGPVAGLQTQLLGNAGGDVAFGTARNDFINMLGGDDAIDAGAGDDVIDGGTGSNFLSGGAGRDDFFLDGRGGGSTWSTITDWQAGERVAVLGWKPGISQVLWLDSDGTPGFTGVTMHGDLDGNGQLDTSVTWSGKTRADLPVPLEFPDLLWFI